MTSSRLGAKVNWDVGHLPLFCLLNMIECFFEPCLIPCLVLICGMSDFRLLETFTRATWKRHFNQWLICRFGNSLQKHSGSVWNSGPNSQSDCWYCMTLFHKPTNQNRTWRGPSASGWDIPKWQEWDWAPNEADQWQLLVSSDVRCWAEGRSGRQTRKRHKKV